jgi:hypothetical protein
MLHKLRLALAATLLALTAVPAFDGAWAIENIRVNGILLPVGSASAQTYTEEDILKETIIRALASHP